MSKKTGRKLLKILKKVFKDSPLKDQISGIKRIDFLNDIIYL
jgi:hypothetical protein